jgi:hypothetical protein
VSPEAEHRRAKGRFARHRCGIVGILAVVVVLLVVLIVVLATLPMLDSPIGRGQGYSTRASTSVTRPNHGDLRGGRIEPAGTGQSFLTIDVVSVNDLTFTSAQIAVAGEGGLPPYTFSWGFNAYNTTYNDTGTPMPCTTAVSSTETTSTLALSCPYTIDQGNWTASLTDPGFSYQGFPASTVSNLGDLQTCYESSTSPRTECYVSDAVAISQAYGSPTVTFTTTGDASPPWEYNNATLYYGDGTYLDLTSPDATLSHTYSPSSQVGCVPLPYGGDECLLDFYYGPASSSNGGPWFVVSQYSDVFFGSINPSENYSVNFAESGLPTGMEWWVNATNVTTNVAESFNGTGTAIRFSEPNGTYTFTVAAVNRSYKAPGGTFTVQGAPVSKAVSFVSAATLYPVTFLESGLPDGTKWWVNLTKGKSFSGSGTTIAFTEPNGTYSFTVSSPGYQPSPGSGSFMVKGAPLSQTISFTEIPPTTYTVTFSESGLPVGTEWWVNVSFVGSFSGTAATITFAAENGSYSYYLATVDKALSAPAGELTIDGAPVSQAVTFASVTLYEATFTESGLPVGTEWWVNLTNAFDEAQSFSGTESTIIFHEPNGTYDYTLATGNKAVSALGGEFMIDGTPISVPATFVPPVTYSTGWQPQRDAYTISNAYGQFVSCFGLSSTALLYYLHYYGSSGVDWSYPTFPNQPGGSTSTAGLQGSIPSPGHGPNNVTLAIALHQAFGQSGLSSNFNNNGNAFGVLLSDIKSGQPTLVGLGPKNLHEVVAWAITQYGNGSSEINFSDPDFPGQTTQAWFYSDGFFSYIDPQHNYWSAFTADGIPSLMNWNWPWANPAGWKSNQAWLDGVLSGDRLVIAARPVTVTEVGPTGTLLQDRFSNLLDSQTFHEGIPGSAGFEENGVQAYSVPGGGSASLNITDPSSGSSEMLELWVNNESGVPFGYGFAVQAASPSEHDLSVTNSPTGFELAIGMQALTTNLTLFSWSGDTFAILNATNLTFESGDQVTLSVGNWTALNSTTASTVTVSVTAPGGQISTYPLVNGQNGLPPPEPSSSGGEGFPGSIPVLGPLLVLLLQPWHGIPAFGLLLVLLVVGVSIGLARRRRPPTVPASRPPTTPNP